MSHGDGLHSPLPSIFCTILPRLRRKLTSWSSLCRRSPGLQGQRRGWEMEEWTSRLCMELPVLWWPIRCRALIFKSLLNCYSVSNSLLDALEKPQVVNGPGLEEGAFLLAASPFSPTSPRRGKRVEDPRLSISFQSYLSCTLTHPLIHSKLCDLRQMPSCLCASISSQVK